jgi:hypothetical protein
MLLFDEMATPVPEIANVNQLITNLTTESLSTHYVIDREVPLKIVDFLMRAFLLPFALISKEVTPLFNE